MDHDRTSFEWSDRDLSNFTCQFANEKAAIVIKLRTKEGTRFEINRLATKEDWKTWFKDAVKNFLPSSAQPGSGICAVILGRVSPVFDDDDDNGANTQPPISYLPFDDTDILSQLVHEFHLHPRITRTIGRLSCYFSAQRYHCDEDDLREGSMEIRPTITCTARTSSIMRNDIALSTAYFSKTDLNLAVFYGCSEDQTEGIIRRIKACDLKQNHPLLLLGLFFELERIRLVDEVENLLDNFELRNNFEYNQLESPSGPRELDLDMDKERMTHVLKSTYKSRELVSLIMAVKRQLNKFELAMDMVENHVRTSAAFSPDPATETASTALSSPPVAGAFSSAGLLSDNGENTHKKIPQLTGASGYLRLEKAGKQIRERLQDILFEFDDKINDCHLVKDNVSLTIQTVWSFFSLQDNQTNLRLSKLNTKLAHANTNLSVEMKKDSSQMRSIALLTMVFLPMSTVAAIFSSDFFSWDAGEGKSVVSKYFWVFVVVAIALTGIVVGAWYMATCGKDRNNNRRCGLCMPFGLFGGKGAKDDKHPSQPHGIFGRKMVEDEEAGIPLGF